MKRHLILTLLAATAVLITACKKENTDIPGGDSNGNKQGFVLNEGLWGSNNASLCSINLDNGEITTNFFASNNGRGLGDVAQDALIYGSKIYVTVSESKTLEVINTATGASIKQISFPASPRYMVSHQGSIYVSCYDKSVVRIDTASLNISGSASITSMNPEGIAIAGDKLYVCSSWGYTASGDVEYDNKIIVVDLASFSQTATITVGTNPQRVKSLSDGRLVYCYTGNYSDIAGGLAILNPSNASSTEMGIACSGFDIHNGNIYTYSYDWGTGATAFYRINISDLSKTSLSLDGSFTSVYGINVNPSNGDIYITDSQNFSANGDVLCFAADGTRKWSAAAGVGPSKVVF